MEPTDARFEAPLLLIDSTPVLPTSNQPCSQLCSQPELEARLFNPEPQEAGMGGTSAVI